LHKEREEALWLQRVIGHNEEATQYGNL
jgi:hypothetical protein